MALHLCINYPIDSLDKFYNWNYPASSNVTIPLQKCTGLWDDYGKFYDQHDYPQVIYCHDMAGGYLDHDKVECKTSVFPAFRFIYWHLIDIFIYFSHSTITIPPICWINAAHRQGVKVYGTFIIEDNENFAYEFFNDYQAQNSGDDVGSSKLIQFATRLNQIRSLMGFEGWLVNVEIDFTSTTACEAFCLFLRFLRNLGSEVIWYDALSKRGSVKYWNSLSKGNLPFFEASGKLFLNYLWNTDLLQKSQNLSTSSMMSSKIFVGIDCFGRKCAGGGGFGTAKAIKMVRDVVSKCPSRPLSIALFAPGWIFENCNLDSVRYSPQLAFEKIAKRDAIFWFRLGQEIAKLRGSILPHKPHLHRPTLTHFPVISHPYDMFQCANSRVCFRTNCCSGHEISLCDELNASYSSQMNQQQIFPSCRKLADGQINEDANLFEASQHLCTNHNKESRSCLFIRWHMSAYKIRPESNIVMELFTFPNYPVISSNAQVNIAICPWFRDSESFDWSEKYSTSDASLDAFEHPRLGSVSLVVDLVQTDGFENENESSHSNRVYIRPYKVQFTCVKDEYRNGKNRVWILLNYPLDQMALRQETNNLLPICRIGLAWTMQWTTQSTCGTELVKLTNEGFLLSQIEILDNLRATYF